MHIFKQKVIIFFAIFISLFVFFNQVKALGSDESNPAVEAKIVKVIEEKEIKVMETTQLYQKT